ncbi:MAG: hypothetical protein PHS92_04340 [Candidatus Gracilibacteria bacterium]|nr:hypothetical protein [Candidatus Gracilibacteria bacterium]
MIKRILSVFSDIFIVPEEKIILKEIYLNKTEHYKEELDKLYLDSVFVCLEYDENLKKLLKSYKYDYNKKLNKSLSEYLKNYGGIFLEEVKEKDIFVCGIPLNLINHLKRGYNQTYLLAEIFAKGSGLKFIKPLYKTRYTKSQSKLSRDERLKNIIGAFHIKRGFKDNLASKTIILVDDVISSGSTSNEVAKILKQNGAEKVIGLFLASGH